MQVKVVNHIPFSELERKLRAVPLKGKNDDGSDIFVYEDARITLREMDPDEVNPTTFYLLRKNMDFQKDLREHLMKNHNIDPWHLDGAVEIENDDGEIWTLTPPIVEVTPRRVQYQFEINEIPYGEHETIQIPIINDGAHRVYAARFEGDTFHGVFISGAHPRHPFYAHPNEWGKVKIVDDVPATKKEKKYYSREDCYALYRDFDVLGCGKPRGVKGESTEKSK